MNFLVIGWNKKLKINLSQPFWIMGMIVLEALTGILMYYVDFPMGTQTFHLIAGAILFGLQLQLWFISRLRSKEI